MQTGLEDNPAFTVWQTNGQGAGISAPKARLFQRCCSVKSILWHALPKFLIIRKNTNDWN